MNNVATQEKSGTAPADGRTDGLESSRPSRRGLRHRGHAQQAAACLRIRDGLRRRGKRLDSIEPSDFRAPELAEIVRGIRRASVPAPGSACCAGSRCKAGRTRKRRCCTGAWAPTWAAPAAKPAGRPRLPGPGHRPMVLEARGSKTNSELIFHTDSSCAFADSRPDVLALLCLRKAVSGGESVMVSGHTAYNALLQTRPELVDELYGTFCFDRSKETGPARSR